MTCSRTLNGLLGSLLLVPFLNPSPCFAWGDEGHEVIGLIADHYLKAPVKQKVNALLDGDATHLTTNTQIASEATWADKFRDSDRNTTHVHYNQTHEWHFVDIEINGGDIDSACFNHPVLPVGKIASLGPSQDCVVDNVDEFMAELKSPDTSTDERRLALQFLLHFIGDIRQPLHASDDHDKGGNDKKVKGPGVGTNNLHHDWDTEFVKKIDSDPDKAAAQLIAKITPAQKIKWAKGSARDWAQESYAVARAKVYGPLPAVDSTGKYVVSATYISNATKATATQLSRAGVRLAHVLNEALQ
jgi:hypothetical protein